MPSDNEIIEGLATKLMGWRRLKGHPIDRWVTMYNEFIRDCDDWNPLTNRDDLAECLDTTGVDKTLCEAFIDRLARKCGYATADCLGKQAVFVLLASNPRTAATALYEVVKDSQC